MQIEDRLRALACKNGGGFRGASEDVKCNQLGRKREGLKEPTISERWWLVLRRGAKPEARLLHSSRKE